MDKFDARRTPLPFRARLWLFIHSHPRLHYFKRYFSEWYCVKHKRDKCLDLFGWECPTGGICDGQV